ncbi:MAG: selenocysteine-specific translation elongation factor [Acidobacteria bacterium]|nr:MAG: selenocysteine-specific translation elongation factor [Acidobacteriota bacterium]
MRNIVVGTAGHIDHGKSALVEALTGTHPDRLEEEKRRGITLDIGFAFLELGEISIGFVDVPGHERFVRNMLAGASGFDLVLLVIAADESIKPQTREHFEICRLLGIPRGLVVLTKCDLVEPEVLELVRLETEEFIRGSFLEGVPIVAVSARTGAGLEELRRQLARIAGETPPKGASRCFRLPIDRAFAMKGFGTVVTGTLIAGEVKTEDEVELFPSRRRLRVRGVQSGGKPVLRASAGQRTALNLAGIEHQEVRRGMVLATPKRFEATSRLDARIVLLPSAKRLKHRARVHFHHGSSETIAEIHLFGAREMMPASTGLAQLRLADATLALPGDRFILRQFSPVITIGGGTVLYIPRGRRLRDPQAVSFLEVQERGLHGDFSARADALRALVSSSVEGSTLADLVMHTGWPEEEIRRMVDDLAAEGKLRLVTEQPFLAVSAEVLASCVDRLVKEVERFHRANPLAEAISKEDLRTRCASGLRAEIFRAALKDAVSANKLALAGDLVKRAGRAVHLQPGEARAKEQIEREFARGGLAAPGVEAVLTTLPVEMGQAQKLFQLLLRERVLLRISNDVVLHRETVDHLRALLAEYKRTRGERLAVADFKELAGISRKYAIPLLEYLDRTGVTRRVGDYRVIL